ncbi:hypothetical protein [Klenkia sp. PcliD-1-E]|uniref:hypothetical protein n=1 Tax=Klenkia sp. PcliD-1-E TaxID=2954492 RepID=UPI0020979702|nr:hypothetical protein [Klenkia sp. PcliD-1-E]MCO7219370.1 hypothetical protein [Klenkia sp. PcliD-1-E]
MSRAPAVPRRPFWRSVEERGVVLVGVPAGIVLMAAIVTISVEAPRSSWLSRVYGATGLFAGNYLPVQGQPDSPTPLMAALGVAALALTFVAALTAVFASTSRARQRYRARRSGTRLVVVGSGVPAAELVRRHLPAGPGELLLVTATERTPAAVASRGRADVQVADLDALSDEVVAGLCERGGQIVVAGEDDAATLELARRLSLGNRAEAPVVAVIARAALVDELRPAEIDAQLVEGLLVTCPAENTAGRVAQELERLLRADPALLAAGSGTVVVDGDAGELTETVQRWVCRLSWARSFLLDEHARPVPRVRPLLDVDGDGNGWPDATFRVVVGADAADVAARALRAVRRGMQDPRRMITVTSASLLPAAQRELVAVVDPRATAWDPDLVFESTAVRWGRMFHSVYSLAFASKEAWSPAGRAGQSSVAAGRFLPRNLADHGFVLVRVDGRPAAPSFTHDEVTSLAAAEHEDWLRRTYREGDGPPQRVPREGSEFDQPWSDLTDAQQERNRTLVRGAAAALPAVLGYEVRRR